MMRLFLICLLLFPSVASATTWSLYTSGTSYGTNGQSWAIQDGGTVVDCIQGTITSDIFHAIPGADIAVHRSNADCTGTNNGQVGSSALGNDDYDFYLYHSGSTVRLYYSTDYVPPPTEPSYCSDGEQSDDELGLDCGPSCASPDETCSVYCPVGFNAETRTDGITACYSDDSNTDYYALVKLDTCPDDMFRSATDDELCVSWTLATFASNDYLDGVDSPEIDTTPWNNVVTDETTTNYNSVVMVDGVTTEVVSQTTESVTTDGSASEQVTTETTVTDVDGSSTVTTITETSTRDVTGSVSGQVVTVTDNYDPSGVLTDSASITDNIENTPGAGDSFHAPSSGVFEVDQDLFDSFTVRYEDFYAEIENAPIYTPVSNLFSGPDTSAKSPDFSLAMGSYGTKSFALSTYDQVWSALGVLFIFLATLTTARMIMVRGFSGGN